MRAVSLGLMMLMVTWSGLGCGAGQESLHPTRGTVTVGGKPAAGALVTLIPSDASTNPQVSFGSATCNERGEFTVMTAGQPGARAGTYAVTITWPDQKKVDKGKAKTFSTADSTESADLLQGRYANKETSKLTATIQPGDNLLPTFDLK